MKRTLLQLIATLSLAALPALAHNSGEIGPNGGRILEFSKDETMHGEVTEKGGKFHIALLDKDMKPVPLAEQVLTATSGDRANPQKLPVEKQGDHFVVPVVKAGEWVIFQFKPKAAGKAVTARLEYDTSTCGGCKKAEWLCTCAPEEEAKKKPEKK